MSEPTIKAFGEEVHLALQQLAAPEGDPMLFNVESIVRVSKDVRQTFTNVITDRATNADIRAWLVRLAALTIRAWLGSFTWSPEVLRDSELVSTVEALAIFQSITGKRWEKWKLTGMIESKELVVVDRRQVATVGRKQNFFKREAVMAAANKRATP